MRPPFSGGILRYPLSGVGQVPMTSKDPSTSKTVINFVGSATSKTVQVEVDRCANQSIAGHLWCEGPAVGWINYPLNRSNGEWTIGIEECTCKYTMVVSKRAWPISSWICRKGIPDSSRCVA